MVRQVIIIDGGGGQQREVQVTSFPTEIHVGSSPNETVYIPATVEIVECENDLESERISDQCGRTETRIEGDKNWEVTIEGVITDEDRPSGDGRNLSLNALINDVKTEGVVKLLGDAFPNGGGAYVVDHITYVANHEMPLGDLGHGIETLYEYQIQFKEPEPSSRFIGE